MVERSMKENESNSGRYMLHAVTAAIVLVNVISIYGQVQWFWRDEHLPLIGAIGTAISLESIALALSAMAHHAMISGDSAWTLALGSRGMSIVAGGINLSHYSPYGITHPSTLGIVFGLLSSSSGFLWGALAKRQARDKFMEQGIIERRTVKIGMPMWVLYPHEALERLKTGVWHGENRVAEVRRLVEEKRAIKIAEEIAKETEPKELTLEDAPNQASAIRVALMSLPESATTQEVADYLASAHPRAWSVTHARIRQVRSAERDAQARAEVESRRSNVRALPGAAESV
jgi:hypothetical protein